MTESVALTRGAPTLHDVAREAGVSLATASRVLNGSNRKVADSYRVRVEAAATKLGYTANVAAQAIARGASAITAFVVTDMTDDRFGALTRALVHETEAAGLILTVAETGGDPERERKILQTLRGQRPQGLILGEGVAGSEGEALAEIAALQAMGTRVVTFAPDGTDDPDAAARAIRVIRNLPAD
ncbi:LacI family DNA-binding transcriptional regulator [Microbacterium invictum]|uniref:LacI family DNA-binding transcriptional regulator n=1 Tax=Microbacterium invictum TaxID=515415 RepID=A0ABZ0VC77_9MICO|nr:LacI family DNA-binding transcriptional regulator [Microbacterium invictum]WQB70971.1 LacI family DNA-binding transcriptional regulator [Microbacterium invictum]